MPKCCPSSGWYAIPNKAQPTQNISHHEKPDFSSRCCGKWGMSGWNISWTIIISYESYNPMQAGVLEKNKIAAHTSTQHQSLQMTLKGSHPVLFVSLAYATMLMLRLRLHTYHNGSRFFQRIITDRVPKKLRNLFYRLTPNKPPPTPMRSTTALLKRGSEIMTFIKLPRLLTFIYHTTVHSNTHHTR